MDGWFFNAPNNLFVNLEKRFGYKAVKEILLATEFLDIDEEPTKQGGVRVRYRIKPDLNFYPQE